MKTRKWLYLILALVLAVPILFFYHAFNGNPLWKVTAKKTLTTYLEETYPQSEFIIHDGVFNFKINGYVFDVEEMSERNEHYEFEVTDFLKQTVTNDGIYNANLDIPLMEKFNEEAAAEIERVLKPTELIYIAVMTEVLQGTYAADTVWSKELTLEEPLTIHLTIDATTMEPEEILTTVNTIKKKLDDANYDYGYVSFNGNILDGKIGEEDDIGYVKYAVSFEKDTQLSLKDIREHEA